MNNDPPTPPPTVDSLNQRLSSVESKVLNLSDQYFPDSLAQQISAIKGQVNGLLYPAKTTTLAGPGGTSAVASPGGVTGQYVGNGSLQGFSPSFSGFALGYTPLKLDESGLSLLGRSLSLRKHEREQFKKGVLQVDPTTGEPLTTKTRKQENLGEVRAVLEQRIGRLEARFGDAAAKKPGLELEIAEIKADLQDATKAGSLAHKAAAFKADLEDATKAGSLAGKAAELKANLEDATKAGTLAHKAAALKADLEDAAKVGSLAHKAAEIKADLEDAAKAGSVAQKLAEIKAELDAKTNGTLAQKVAALRKTVGATAKGGLQKTVSELEARVAGADGLVHVVGNTGTGLVHDVRQLEAWRETVKTASKTVPGRSPDAHGPEVGPETAEQIRHLEAAVHSLATALGS